MALTHTFYSTDTGAPSLTGQVGSGIAVLDAILVNGYNEHTTGVSITRSGTTATVSKTAHGYRDGQIVNIRDANEADYNGNFRITYVDANTFTYTVANSPSTPATGTIKTKVAPLGWTKPYSGTNLAAYRSKSGTNQLYYRFDDTDGQLLRVRGYETMSDVNTGAGPFPTTTQLATAPYLYKSSVSTSATRSWFAFSDGKIVYFFSLYSETTYTGCCAAIFGDFKSTRSSDPYGSCIVASTDTSSTGLDQVLQSNSSVQSGHYICRSNNQIGSAATFWKSIDAGLSGTSSNTAFGYQGLAFPHAPNGGLYLTPIRLMESATVYRGNMPGLWNPAHYRPLAHLDEFNGSGDFSGKRFKMLNISANGQVAVEISDTWGT